LIPFNFSVYNFNYLPCGFGNVKKCARCQVGYYKTGELREHD
jgi:hypothetical protein